MKIPRFMIAQISILSCKLQPKTFFADKHDERHKMITNSTEENLPSKLEATSVDHGKASKAAASSSSSGTPWLRLKDPRIVRVSRAFGGKDRHSKVCTIRGLRDRRVRLSVSTAIQLYDLQDRLGLNQPSKVVDWLLNAAKDEIDELPPLPIPSGSLGLNYQSMLAHSNSHGSAAGAPQTNEFKINCNGINWEASSCHESNRSKFGNNSKALDRESMNEDEEKQDKNGGLNQKQVAANNHSTRTNSAHPSSFSALLNNVAAPFGYHWDPSNLPSSHHMGSHGLFTSQAEDHLHNFNVLSLPSPLSLSTGSQIFVCPPVMTQSLEIDPRQVNHLQMFSSSSQNFLLNNSLTPPLHSINQPAMRPFHFSMAPKFISQEKNNGDQANKDDEFASDE